MTYQLFPYPAAMAEPRWLNEQEARAWRQFLFMSSRLRRQLGTELQRATGLSAAVSFGAPAPRVSTCRVKRGLAKGARSVTELDRAGRTVWQFRSDLPVFRARRR